MSTLQIGGAVATIFIGLIALYFSNQYNIKKHRFAFFTIANFITAFIAVGFIMIGYKWTVAATPNSDDIMNGIGMTILGVFVGMFLIVINKSKTSWGSAVTAFAIKALILAPSAYLAHGLL